MENINPCTRLKDDNIVEDFQENFFIRPSISFVYKSFYKQKTFIQLAFHIILTFEPTFLNLPTGILEKIYLYYLSMPNLQTFLKAQCTKYNDELTFMFI